MRRHKNNEKNKARVAKPFLRTSVESEMLKHIVFLLLVWWESSLEQPWYSRQKRLFLEFEVAWAALGYFPKEEKVEKSINTTHLRVRPMRLDMPPGGRQNEARPTRNIY